MASNASLSGCRFYSSQITGISCQKYRKISRIDKLPAIMASNLAGKEELVLKKYRLLESYFHQDPHLAEEMYEQRFQSENTFVLPVSIGKHPAFVALTPEIFRLSVILMKEQMRLESLEKQIPCHSAVMMDSIFQEIEISNEIEGVHSSRKDLEAAWHAQPDTRFAGQLRQYHSLMKKSQDFPDTPEAIRTIYDEMLLHDIEREDPANRPDGRLFRQGQVYIHDGTKNIHTGLVPEERIIEVLEQSLQLVHQEEIPFWVRTAVFHFLFGYIHPFYDGNGRMNRYLSSLLIEQEWGVLAALQVSLAIRKNKSRYYKAFEKAEKDLNRGELTDFVHVFMEMMETVLKQEIDNLERQSEKLNAGRDAIEKMELSKLEKKLMKVLLSRTLFTVQGATKKELAAQARCSDGLVRRFVLKYKDRLFVTKEGRMNRYLLDRQFLETLLKPDPKAAEENG